MVKAPIAGAVKTRLARAIGSAEAVRFYRTTTAATVRRLGRDPRWQLVLAVTPDATRDAPFWSADVQRIPQGKGDIGQRMARLLDAMAPGPVVLIGSDIPYVRPVHIARAFDRLRSADLVFGPATDGGFWLVGQNRPGAVRGAFAGVRWSNQHTLADTLANLEGRRVALADTLSDVDDERDWRRWRRDR
ncbi:MAG: TIGR04282 family arsenosugar biosynthesis glycosyltransferase [Rhodobiaceae bacterium]|nr:TIGR04282 family arsenosugar biosynthesis glycosyltransferase [Rhodobiaceae bacterium]